MDQERLRPYVGRTPRIDDPLMRAAYLRGIAVSEFYYPKGTADYDQKAAQVLLTGETAEYLYSAFTPLSLHYVPGTRPALERVVARVVKPEMTERERVLAVRDFCLKTVPKEYPCPLPPKTLLLNAAEEEVLKLGGGQCEDRSRLIVCLCQIAGLPARCVAVYSHFRPEENYALRGGHAIVEIYCEGGWAFFDSSVMDFWCRRPDGRIASLWDLRQHPEWVEQQGDEFYRARGETKERFVWYRDEYLTTRAAATITNYFVWEGWRYDWRWVRISYDPNDEGHRKGKQMRNELRRRLLREAGVDLKE